MQFLAEVCAASPIKATAFPQYHQICAYVEKQLNAIVVVASRY